MPPFISDPEPRGLAAGDLAAAIDAAEANEDQ
jgi:hypothetical protein